MKLHFTLYLFFLFSLTATAQELLEKTITVDDTLEREYLLYVPAAYDGSEEWPLMFNLHGASSNPQEQLFFSGMNTVADTGHFLVAYPLGIQNADGFEGTGWNARLLPDFQDDVLFINNLIDAINSEYSVDLARVYACGMSNGGGMSYTLSCTLPDRIAAIATVASPGVLEDCDPQRPFPYLYIHGTEDTYAPFNGGQSTSLPQLDIEFPAAYEHLQSLLERNGCTPDSTVIEFEDVVPDDNSTISVRKFTNCDTYLDENGVEQPAEVWFYVIENGGHVWPGVSLPPFFGNSNLDINASAEIWDFFQRHTLPRQPQLLEKTITIDGLEREYLLYVPAAYDGSEEWPLVLNLHGYLWDGEAQIWISDMNPVADTAHFLIAYPTGQMLDLSEVEGLPTFIPGQGVGWNLGNDVAPNDDITFLSQMIDEIVSEYQVDENRIYSTGFSMGGIMSYMLACDHAGRIAAIAPVGANLLPEEGEIDYSCVPSSPVPVLHIHGTNDTVDPFEGSAVFQGTLNSVNFWLEQNGCGPESETNVLDDLDTTDQSTVTSIKYNDCDEETEVWLYRIDGGGHWWPGGGALPASPGWQALGPVNRDINASAEIWNFFQRHTLPREPQLLEKTITVDGLEREYLLYVPAAYDGSEEWPLVLNLHPILANGNKQMILTNMNAVADTANFLVAYPNGTPIGQDSTRLNWNVSLSTDGPDDVNFLAQLIDTLSMDYNINPCRIFSAGYDTGGMISYRLACLMPSRFAAVASIGGIAPIEFEYALCTPGTPFPLLHMHGTADPFIPFNGGTDGAGNTSPPTREVIGNWLSNNDCAPDSTVVEFEDVVPDDNTTVSKIEYTNCAFYIGPDEMGREAEVWFYIVENGGHGWPGAPAALYPTDIPPLDNLNLDIDASVEIWNFFSRHLNTGDPSCATIVSTKTAPPASFRLRAFPNPASSQLTFEFELPEAARVQISLYNPLGQPVQILAEENLPAGQQQINWERTSSVSAGLYYYRLQVGERMVSGAVVLR